MKLDNKGFTLVEVLAVVVIIAVIGMIAIPGVMSSINTGKDASYKIMVNNIVTASKSLYEEIEYNNSILYKYDDNGKTSDEVSILDDSIIVNLQTLVSNGFLSGSNKENDTNNKVLINPKTKEDIGLCEIKITKKNFSNKVTYEISSKNNLEGCPSDDDYKEGVK